MPLEPVHVMEMDRATSRLELTHINKTRQFLMNTDTGMGLYTWQNGAWYDTGDNPIDEKDVPEKFRKEIEDNPVVVTDAKAPSVTAVCKYCKEKMNQSEIEQHYIRHMDEVLAQAGTRPVEKNPRDVAAKADQNTHGSR